MQESPDALKVRPRTYQPERVTKVVTPVEVFSPAPGVWTFDLGEMISGGVEWQVPDDLPAGAEVVFRYGQELRRQGSHMAGLEWHYPPENQTADKSRLIAQYSESGIVINMGGPNKSGASGTLSRQKTLSHIPCDLYISGGRKSAMWRSSERNHAFRYVEVVGLKSEPRIDSLKGIMIHNDSPQVGTFQSSEPHLNRFHDMCVKTELMNEHGIFSDCWDREKWAWGGNWTKGRFILYAHDSTGLIRKATTDYAEALRRNGKLGFDTFNIGNPWASTTVIWPASFLYWPWEAYKFDGDIRPLRENFDSFLRHIRDVYERQQLGGKSLVIKTDTSIADWLWFGQVAAGGWLKDRPELKEKWTDGKPFGFFAPRSQCHVLSTAMQCDQAGILARIAGMLGRTEDAKWLNDLHERTKAALHREFYNPTAFSYGKNPDSGPWGADVEDSVVLDTGIAPPEVRDRVYAQMLEGLRKRGHQPISGIITMQNFTSVLADHGAADDAYEVYSREGPCRDQELDGDFSGCPGRGLSPHQPEKPRREPLPRRHGRMGPLVLLRLGRLAPGLARARLQAFRAGAANPAEDGVRGDHPRIALRKNRQRLEQDRGQGFLEGRGAAELHGHRAHSRRRGGCDPRGRQAAGGCGSQGTRPGTRHRSGRTRGRNLRLRIRFAAQVMNKVSLMNTQHLVAIACGFLKSLRATRYYRPVLAALLLAPLAALHAATPTSEENAAAEQWAQSNVFAEPAKLPFSFTLAGKSSDELLRDWQRTDATRELDAQRRERTLHVDGQDVRLTSALVATEYTDFPSWNGPCGSRTPATKIRRFSKTSWDSTPDSSARTRASSCCTASRGDSCVAESYQSVCANARAGAREALFAAGQRRQGIGQIIRRAGWLAVLESADSPAAA